MSKAKFTPGPWSKRAIAAALRAAHKNDGSWIDELGDGENMPDEDDASLIAVASELYNELNLVAHRYNELLKEHGLKDTPLMGRVVRILAKARGVA